MRGNMIRGRVKTPDGPGRVVGQDRRANDTGPGTRQVRVQLDDGRVRHYSRSEVKPEHVGKVPL